MLSASGLGNAKCTHENVSAQLHNAGGSSSAQGQQLFATVQIESVRSECSAESRSAAAS
jgi:hypothetical protein